MQGRERESVGRQLVELQSEAQQLGGRQSAELLSVGRQSGLPLLPLDHMQPGWQQSEEPQLLYGLQSFLSFSFQVSPNILLFCIERIDRTICSANFEG
jgi:hypothetical protein